MRLSESGILILFKPVSNIKIPAPTKAGDMGPFAIFSKNVHLGNQNSGRILIISIAGSGRVGSVRVELRTPDKTIDFVSKKMPKHHSRMKSELTRKIKKSK